MAEALYRKYRPQVFGDVVGQEHIERTIKNAIEQDKLSHAYLFTGPRGTGKTTTARLLAKALLCECGPTAEPDGTCEDCRLIAAGEHPDVYELDAASRTGVDNVREEIIGRVQFAPTRGRYKVYIIDEVHMLTIAAFNALLKTLEEPPSHVVFVLATTDPQKVPETIHSRCQRFDFHRITNEAIVSRLGAICVAEDVEFEGEALELIAHHAGGGMRNALTSLEQLIAFGDGAVTLAAAERILGGVDSSDLSDIVKFVGARDAASCFRWTAEFMETGSDLAQFTRGFAEHIRNMYVMSLAGQDVPLEVSTSERRQLAEELPLFGPDRLARLLGVLGDLSAELKTSTNPRLSFEIALTRMVRPDSDLTLESLAERIEALESGYAATAQVLPGAVAQAAQPQMAQPQPARTAQVQPAQAVQPQPAQTAQTRTQPAQIQPQPAQTAQTRTQPAQIQPQPAQPQPAQPQPAQSASAQAAGGVPAGVADSMRNPAALQRMWQSAVAIMKKRKTAHGVLFLNTKAVFDEASSSLAIDFPAENDFLFNAVQKPDVLDALSDALAQACGAPVAFRLTKGGAGGTPVHAAASSGARCEAASSQAAPARDVAGRSGAPSALSARSSQVSASSPSGASPAAGGAPRPEGRPGASARDASPGLPPDATTGASPVASFESPTGHLPYDDQVPVDLYDDVVPYEDEVPFDLPPIGGSSPSAAPQRAASPARAEQPRAGFEPAPAPAAAVATAAATAAVAAAPAAAGAPGAPKSDPAAGDERSIAELNEALTAAFGAGVTFQEL